MQKSMKALERENRELRASEPRDLVEPVVVAKGSAVVLSLSAPGLELSAAKLVLFRVLFFGVFAIDAWLQIAHAPRYGHGDFNVAHFAFLDPDQPVPGDLGSR